MLMTLGEPKSFNAVFAYLNAVRRSAIAYTIANAHTLFLAFAVLLIWPIFVIPAIVVTTAIVLLAMLAFTATTCLVGGAFLITLVVLLSHQWLGKLRALLPAIVVPSGSNRWDLATRILGRDQNDSAFKADVDELFAAIGTSTANRRVSPSPTPSVNAT